MYTAADIQKYLKGELSAEEMHAMERAALDDPFLADAMEGMEQTLQTNEGSMIDTHLQSLGESLKDRVASASQKALAPVRSMRWWQVAAAAVVLVAGSVWAYDSFMRSAAREKILASQRSTKTTAVVPVTDSLAENNVRAFKEDSTTTPSPSPNRSVAHQTRPTVKNKISSERSDNRAGVLADIKDDETDTAGHHARQLASAEKEHNKEELSEAERSAASSSHIAKTKIPGKNAKDSANASDVANNKTEKPTTEVVSVLDKSFGQEKVVARKQQANEYLRNVIKGQVVDPFNKPLANAFLQPDQDRNSFITDKNGYFNIPARDSTLNVSVSAFGFTTQKVQLQNNALPTQIQLQPVKGELNDVVVTGYSSRKKQVQSNAKAKEPTIMVQDAQPVYGWVGYEQYLDANKKRPDSTSLSGDVVISFLVNRKGELSGFKVVQSLDKAYDEESIRLIKEGPSWKLLKGRKARATVIIHW